MNYEAEVARLSVLIRAWYRAQLSVEQAKSDGKPADIIAVEEWAYAEAEGDLSEEAMRIIDAEKLCPALPWQTTYDEGGHDGRPAL
jgi:hypothetical protein